MTPARPPRRRRRAAWPLLAAAAGLLACGPPPPARNLIVVCIDTLRADHVGAYGYPRDTTPNLDALARRGALLAATQSASNWTAPAVASIFTGLYPTRHGAVLPGELKHLGRRQKAPNGIASGVATLPELLRRAGFATALYSGNPYLYGRFQSGFDEVRVKGGDAARDLEPARAWLREHAGRGFFLYWQIMDLHQPIDPPPAAARRYAPEAPADFPADIHRGWTYGNLRRADDPGFAEYRRLRIALYDGALRHVDELVGTLLDDLRALGLEDETLVMVTADHGEEFWEHSAEQAAAADDPRGIWGIGHGHSMYQELLHVPWIVAGPGVRPGRRIACPVSLVDLVPTALARLGLAAPPGLDGRDLGPLLAGRDGECAPRALVAEAPAYGRDSAALRYGRWKLLWRADEPARLFDLERDPGERHDLALARRRETAALGALLARLRAGERAGEPAAAAELAPEQLEQLRALGYL